MCCCQEECWGQWEPHQARFALVFFPFFPFFSTSGGVASAASGPVCPRFFSLFFPRQEEWREAHQARFALVFPFFSTSGGVASAASGPVCPCFFPFFSTSGGVLGAAPGPVCPCFFPFFSTSGGVLGAASGPICPRFFPFSTSGGVGRRRQLCRVGGPSGDCSLSLWGTCILLRGRMEIQGASQTCFFFKRLHHLAA